MIETPRSGARDDAETVSGQQQHDDRERKADANGEGLDRALAAAVAVEKEESGKQAEDDACQEQDDEKL